MLEERMVATFTVETRDDVDGVWLCVDDGTMITPLARFVSEDEVKRFFAAQTIYFRKAQTMALMGI